VPLFLRFHSYRHRVLKTLPESRTRFKKRVFLAVLSEGMWPNPATQRVVNYCFLIRIRGHLKPRV
jgi:hypothetical protein